MTDEPDFAPEGPRWGIANWAPKGSPAEIEKRALEAKIDAARQEAEQAKSDIEAGFKKKENEFTKEKVTYLEQLNLLKKRAEHSDAESEKWKAQAGRLSSAVQDRDKQISNLQKELSDQKEYFKHYQWYKNESEKVPRHEKTIETLKGDVSSRDSKITTWANQNKELQATLEKANRSSGRWKVGLTLAGLGAVVYTALVDPFNRPTEAKSAQESGAPVSPVSSLASLDDPAVRCVLAARSAAMGVPMPTTLATKADTPWFEIPSGKQADYLIVTPAEAQRAKNSVMGTLIINLPARKYDNSDVTNSFSSVNVTNPIPSSPNAGSVSQFSATYWVMNYDEESKRCLPISSKRIFGINDRYGESPIAVSSSGSISAEDRRNLGLEPNTYITDLVIE